ncbi:tRNA lysidine(34) synthetase TilS [Cellvibrio sp. OA-2007]|uniref:tRNA lysidine(34) synthetase TilS n=1 Tax=Cellvibrio sp. OA-2007 TaxID=529823 RepID=UPI0007812882|nr:tRNA lysidine(34) synthetase TilS [Cellvibrio sp. OA-2007]
MDFTAEQLRTYLPPITSPSAIWWIGFSGGLDSTVLLHALTQLALPVQLRALHINHQISPNANAWQAQCADFCAQHAVPFHAEKVRVENSGKGIEDAAREIRYAVFEKNLAPNDVLFTAHHANDQAETLLLRLLRGTGPRGLAAMTSVRALGAGLLVRPLLHFSRADLEAYARVHQLQWVDDESNLDDDYDRNFLRNQVMPLLQDRWPEFKRKWQQTAELCAQQEAIVEELAREDLWRAAPQAARVGQSIELDALRQLSPARQQNLLRFWLRSLHYTTPEQLHWQQIERQIIHGRDDAQTRVSWGNVALQTYRQRLYLLPVQLPEMQLQFELTNHDSSPRLKADLPALQIRYRTGGERCKPAGRAHSQTLKKLLQDYALEPWLRDKVPLVFSGDELVAVGDLWVCTGFVAAEDEAGFALYWR